MSEFDPDSKKQDIIPNPEMVIRKVLSSGERILWQGQPIASRIFKAAFAIYLFAIPWTAFALFWETMAMTPFTMWLSHAKPDGPPLWVAVVFPLFGLPFIGIGFWLLAKPFTLLREARETHYAITNQRALVIVESKVQETTSYPFEAMREEIRCLESRDGSGSLLFAGQDMILRKRGTRMQERGFMFVPHVREVEEKLRRARAEYEAIRQAEKPSSPSH